MNNLIGYIKLSENQNLHFCLPVFLCKSSLMTAVVNKDTETIEYFRPLQKQKYISINDNAYQIGSPYPYICLHNNIPLIGNFHEIASQLSMKAHLGMLKSIEKYELYSFLGLYHETKIAAQNYSEELKSPFINVDSFILPDLIPVESDLAWNVIQNYGDLLSHCKNSLSIDQVLKVHSKDSICIGKFTIEMKNVFKLFLQFGHLTKDFGHDLLVYISHLSNLDEKLLKNENYRLYSLFEIYNVNAKSIKSYEILAQNSQSNIRLEKNAVQLSYEIDSELFKMKIKETMPKNEAKVKMVEEIAKKVFEEYVI